MALQLFRSETEQGFLWRWECVVFSMLVYATQVLPVNLFANWVSQERMMGELKFSNTVFGLHFFI